MVSFLEYAVECPLTVESCPDTDVENRMVTMKQETTGIIQSCFIQIAVKIRMKCAGENTGQRGLTDSKIMSHFGKRQFFYIMSSNIRNSLVNNVITSNAALIYHFK